MKWMASLLVLFVAAGCMGQQMDQKNDPAMQRTVFTPHRNNITKERQRNDVMETLWVVGPYIVERYDHTGKTMGIVVELQGNKQVLKTGAGGILFTIDGKQIGISQTILANANRKESCALTRCTVSWTIAPKTGTEQATLMTFVNAVGNGHEVYTTLLPGDNTGGDRFSVKLTDEQVLGFHDAQQFYSSMVLVKKIAQPVAQ